MLNRNTKLILYVSFFVFCIRIIFDLQHIQGDRYSFLDEVKITIRYDKLAHQDKYSVWKTTLDNKVAELSDKHIDSLGSTITYYGVPRITFIKSIFIEATIEQAAFIKSVSVTIGNRTVIYNSLDFQRDWHKTNMSSSMIQWVLPSTNHTNISLIPLINSTINWRGDIVLVRYIIRHNLSLLLFIGLFAFLSFRASDFNKLIRKTKNGLLLCTILIGLGILKNTFTIWALEANLDPSFVAGLAWAKNMGLQWGSDFVFTYGPYFWLTLTSIILNENQLLLALLLNIALTSFSLGIICNFIQKSYLNKQISYTTFLCLLLIVLVFHFDFLDYVVVALLLLVYKFSIRTDFKQLKEKIPYYQVVTALMALLSLIKFSYVAFSISILFILTCIYLYKKWFKDVAILLISYCLWVILLWIISGQVIENILPYLFNGFEIASGYTEAMAKPFWNDAINLSINLINLFLLLIALTTLFLFSLHTALNYAQHKVLLFSTLISPMLFLAFKEGFVRFDAPHMALFYSQLLLLSVICLIVALENGIKLTSVSNKLLIIVISIACCIAPISQFDNLNDIYLIFDKEAKNKLLSIQKNTILEDIEIAETHKSILRKAKTVDVIPTNIALLYAIDAKWKPRPIMQSYSVYTSSLSKLNGQKYISLSAPDYVIMNYFSIDNRYPLFDEPNLFHSLLNNYTLFENYANSYALFERRNLRLMPSKKTYYNIKYILGREFPIYKVSDKHTFMNAKVELTILGKVMSILYKIPPLTMTFITSDHAFTHRVVRRTLTENVFVSSYVSNLSDFEDVLKHKESLAISKITINGNTWFYQNQVNIRFAVW